MADEYSLNINTELYKYIRPVYVIEPTGENRTFIPLRLTLDSNNFNFDLARSDGLDFHLAEKSNGSGVLHMWIAYWDAVEKKASVWFKLPELLASETRTFFAIWGYKSDSGISNLDNFYKQVATPIVYSADQCVGGTATANSEETSFSYTYRAAFAFNDVYTSHWQSDLNDGGYPRWIQYQFVSQKQIQKLRIYPRDSNISQAPREFILKGSNTGSFSGEEVDVASVISATYSQGEYTDFIFTNSNSYLYYRIHITATNNPAEDVVTISEIDMLELVSYGHYVISSDSVFLFADDFDSQLDTLTNFCLGDTGTAFADSYLNVSYVPANAFDGNTSTRWYSTQAPGTAYIGYDFYEPAIIDRVRFYTAESKWTDVVFEASDNQSGPYTVLVNIPGTPADNSWHQYDFTNTAPYKYYRLSGIKGVGGNYSVSIRELEMYNRSEATWSSFGNHTISDSKISLSTDAYIECDLTNPLEGIRSWMIEEGMIGIGSPSSTSVAAHRYRFYGGENVLGIDYYWEGSTDRRHDFITAGSYATYNGINRGLIIGEYNQAYIAYYEPTDRVYQGMTNRGGEATPIYSEDLATDGDRAIASTTNAGNPTAWLAKNAVDGSDSTQWLAGSTDANPWWGYSFSSAEAITRLIINVAALRYITVQGSNDPTASWDSKIWTTVYTDPTPQYAYELFTLDLNNSTPYKYWRLTSVGLGTTGIYEIEMLRINSYSGEFDYDDSWERKVHRNTAVSNFRIYGADLSSAVGVRIDWVIAREFKPDSDPLVNYSGLWIDYEYVAHQSLDYAEYTDDITSVDFYHLSDMGGDPYRVSDNVTNSLLNIFTSDNGITVGSIIIDFGRYNDNVTNNDYIHFNSDNSVEFYNASKLSDLDTDVYDRSYWQTTTTSGWAAIEFPSTKDISCLAMRAVPGQTDRMAKTFKFYGSQSNPRFRGWNDKVLIYEGSARQTEDEQAFYFYTGLTFYKYYILDVLDTHGGNIAIQEWGMYERNSAIGKKVISQLRLHPVAFEENEYYFPKQIELYGSNDGFIWNTLIYNTDTPTPFTDYAYGRWSRYSFENFEAYYQYKLKCFGDWHPDANQIKIAEWEMVESIGEINNFRILAGSSNNMNNIWADPTTTINNGTIYITNEYFNTVEYDKLIHHTDLDAPGIGRPGYWVDEGNVIDDLTYDGVATSSLGTYQGQTGTYGPQFAFDNNLSTYWHSVLYYTYPIWLQYEFPANKRIFEVRMYPRTNFTARMPGDFILKGSNTGAFSGEETDIVSIVGATYSNSQWTTFSFSNANSYLYYRFHITAKAIGSGAGNYMNIFEIEMKGYNQEWIPEYEGAGGVSDFNVKL